MLLTFLSAAIPLTKTISYSARDDKYTTAPYPMVKNFTSHTVEVSNMMEFAIAIREQGKLGRCLLFGGLDKELKDESRAGHAVDAPHEWICLDFDKVDAAPNVDGALYAIGAYLPPAFKAAECVIQLSPSCYHPRASKLSAHVFFRLDQPVDGRVLKDWIVRINFDLLAGQIKLTDSANALSFPLDRCITDASRLLYIAPPKTVGFQSSVLPADQVVHIQGKGGVTVPAFTPVTREEQNVKINQLRADNALPERSFRITPLKGQDMLMDPGEGTIHDVRASGDGYIRFNINGGNSLAYWINLREPQIIGNFKGEPYMFTREVNEAFYKALVKSLGAAPVAMNTSPNMDVLTFYATNRGSAVYVGTYDRANDVLRVDRSTETAAMSWAKQFGIPIKPLLPHYDLVFDISSDIRFEEGYPVINLYARTDFIKDYSQLTKIQPLAEAAARMAQDCPVIFKTLASACGDPRSMLGFVNWLAYIFQTREKTDTAWLLHGTEGTGKGMIIQNICRPLFGADNVGQILMNNVASNFNSLLEGKLIVNIDEAAMSRTTDKVEAMAKLRNWITEDTIVINTKQMVEREVPSFVNFIFTSNDMRPLMIPEGDRRFHVATRQEVRLQYTPNEIAILTQGEELPALAKLLGELQVDEHWVRHPDRNEQKDRLFESTHNLLDRVGMAINAGNTEFFFNARPTDVQRAASSGQGLLPLRQYDELLAAMVDQTLNVLTVDDLFVLFTVVINDSKIFTDNPTQQRSIYNRYNLLAKPKESHRCKRQGKTRHGVKLTRMWQELPDYLYEQHMLDQEKKQADNNVVPMKKGTKK